LTKLFYGNVLNRGSNEVIRFFISIHMNKPGNCVWAIHDDA